MPGTQEAHSTQGNEPYLATGTGMQKELRLGPALGGGGGVTAQPGMGQSTQQNR